MIKKLIIFGLCSVLAMSKTALGERHRQLEDSQSTAESAQNQQTARPLSEEERRVFYAAFGDRCEYDPKGLIKTQVAAGMDYLFLATHIPQGSDDEAYDVKIVIHEPLPGLGEPCTVTRLRRLYKTEPAVAPSATPIVGIADPAVVLSPIKRPKTELADGTVPTDEHIGEAIQTF